MTFIYFFQPTFSRISHLTVCGKMCLGTLTFDRQISLLHFSKDGHLSRDQNSASQQSQKEVTLAANENRPFTKDLTIIRPCQPPRLIKGGSQCLIFICLKPVDNF